MFVLVFAATHGSSFSEWGLLFSCDVQASLCSGFSCCGACNLGRQASVAVAHGLSSCSSWALEHRLSSLGTRALLLCGMRGPPASSSKPCLLHWQADSLQLSHQGSPQYMDLNIYRLQLTANLSSRGF